MSCGRLRNNILLRGLGRAALLLALAAPLGPVAVNAENREITLRRMAERTDFTDDEIRAGFFKIAFNAELQIGAQVDRVRKFEEPVRIYIDRRAQPDRAKQLAEVIADIRSRINHLDIEITSDHAAANFVVALVRDRDVDKVIRARYGAHRATQIHQFLNPQCLSGIGKDGQFRIRRAEAILPVDAGDFTFYDCAYEELLQGFGAINDDSSVPWTMFNDDVQMGFFDVYDQYLLNILYDPRVRPGMARREVEALMPDLLVSARAWVTRLDAQGHGRSSDATGIPPKAAVQANGSRGSN
jgi:hypothetical protein